MLVANQEEKKGMQPAPLQSGNGPGTTAFDSENEAEGGFRNVAYYLSYQI